MDTKTPRTPDPSGRRPGDSQQGGPSGFFDDEPGLSTVKVPSDPAEVVVTHASFRVQLAPPSAGPVSTGQTPAVSGMQNPGPGLGTSVVWGAGTETGETGATRLSHVARPGGWDAAEPAASTTQVLPRIDEEAARPSTVIGQRGPHRSPESTQPRPHSLLQGARPVRGAFDGPESGAYDTYDDTYDGTHSPYGPYDPYNSHGEYGDHGGHGEARRHGERPLPRDEFDDRGPRSASPGAGPAAARRQAYYPGRRLNLGVVLLPMRIFLGFISVYAGMGKLCDPVYFDGDARGSMVTWLRSLEPWTIASPLRDFALAHPVGSGLTVAFLQIIIGVLTVCGLWQRLAASIGALLSAALLMTVSWSSGPAYEAPDIIYLAAWSPLVIAGAPVYSVDGRLAADAWRKLGPRAGLPELRRRVLRRGAVIAAVVTGIALLTGSMLGGAVRASHTAKVPEPGGPPTNQLPGSPLPEEPGARTDSGAPAGGRTQGTDAGAGSRRSGGPSSSASQDGRHRGDSSRPSQRETVQVPRQTSPGVRPPQQSAPGTQSTEGGGASTGGGTSGGGAGGGANSGGGGGGSSSGGSSGGSSSGGGLGGLLG